MKKNTKLKTAFYEYTIGEQIGQGGSGTVYKAVNDNNKNYAIKIIEKTPKNKGKLKRFKNELFFCLKNNHKNIVKIFDYGLHIADDKEYIFYVMPLYEKSLEKLIKEDIAPEDAIKIFIQVAEGLKFAHSKDVIHRDVKPENILYNSLDDIVIADFGIAHFEEDEMLTAVKTKPRDRLANYKYCAPEQKEQNLCEMNATDIFALGLILNEMFTKTVPHGTDFPKIASVMSEFEFLDDLVDLMIKHGAIDRLQPIENILIDLNVRLKDKQSSEQIEIELAKKIDESEIQDSLILDPPKVIGAHMNDNTLVFELNKSVNGLWGQWFSNPGDHTKVIGYEPQRFMLKGNEVSIALRQGYNANLVEKLKKYIDQWIPDANARYKSMIENDH